jgi:hypothetical protein
LVQCIKVANKPQICIQADKSRRTYNTSYSFAIEYSKLGSLELKSAEKNLAHLNGLNAIQFAVMFYDQGVIYLY